MSIMLCKFTYFVFMMLVFGWDYSGVVYDDQRKAQGDEHFIGLEGNCVAWGSLSRQGANKTTKLFG